LAEKEKQVDHSPEKSGKVGDLQSGLKGKVRENGEKLTQTIISFCRHVRANTLSNEIDFLALFAGFAMVTRHMVSQTHCLVTPRCLCVRVMAGIKDSSSVNPDLTLGDLGLDSLMGVEIKQTLERDYDMSMAAKEIRALTFAKLDQLSTSTPQSADSTAPPPSEATNQAPAASLHYDLHHLCPTEAVVEMNHVETDASPLFVISPIEGSVFLLWSLMSKIQTSKVYGIQYTSDAPLSSIPDLASHYITVACVFFAFYSV